MSSQTDKNLGEIAFAINAQVVSFTIAKKATATTLDQIVVGTFNLVGSDESPLDRRNTREGALDFPTHPLDEFTIDAIIDLELTRVFRDLREPTGRGGLNVVAFNVKGLAVNDGNPTGSNDVLFAGTCVVKNFQQSAPERGDYNCKISIRVVGQVTYPADPPA